MADKEHLQRLARLGFYAAYALRTRQITTSDLKKGILPNHEQNRADWQVALRNTAAEDKLQPGPVGLRFEGGRLPNYLRNVLANSGDDYQVLLHKVLVPERHKSRPYELNVMPRPPTHRPWLP
jgi:hypothetical protein